jgi:hypothetical protein
VKRLLVFLAIAISALVFSSAAFAKSITCAHGSTCNAGNLGGPSTGSKTLPFTGLDLAAIAGVAGLLLVSGLTLQRAGRRRR